MAVGTGGDVPHHRRLVTRTGGDEVADHHHRLVTRAGGDDGYHRQFVLPTGGDEAVQDKTPTPSSLPFFPFFPSPRPKSRPVQLVPIQSAARPNPRHRPRGPAAAAAPSPAPGSRRGAVPEPRRCPRVAAPPPPSPVAAVPEWSRHL